MQTLNLLQFCQAACDDPKCVSSATQAYSILFDVNVKLNQDENLYTYLKETRSMSDSEPEDDIVLDSLIVVVGFCHYEE